MRSRVVVIVGIALVLALVGLGVAHTRGMQADAERNTEQATAIVRAFLGDPEREFYAPYGAEPDRPSQWTLYARDGEGAFTVDLDNQVVTMAVMIDPAGPEGPDIPEAQALEAARAFLAPRVPDLEQLTLTGQALNDHGGGDRRYLFQWRLLLGPEGVQSMRSVTANINAATGRVDGFTQMMAPPLTVDLAPRISREEALAIAGERFGNRVRESETTLGVWWRDHTRRDEQVLYWIVEVTGDLPEEMLQERPTPEPGWLLQRVVRYYIDAHTGQVVNETAACCPYRRE